MNETYCDQILYFFTYNSRGENGHNLQGNRIQRYKRGGEPQTVTMAEKPITAIKAVQGRVFYATGRKLFSFSPKSGSSTLIRESEYPLSGLNPTAIRECSIDRADLCLN